MNSRQFLGMSGISILDSYVDRKSKGTRTDEKDSEVVELDDRFFANISISLQSGKLWQRVVLAAMLFFCTAPAHSGQLQESLNWHRLSLGFDYDSLKTDVYSMAEVLSDSEDTKAASEQKETLVLQEDFSEGMDNWWVEGAEDVWVENERLHVKADPDDRNDPQHVATVWHRKPISGNVRIEMKAHVISSTVGANNINIFFFYSDPDGTSLYKTRENRAAAEYRYYHDLKGYIMTLLRDRHMERGRTPDGNAHARFRLRRCPGFNLVDQTYDEMGVHKGQTYKIAITRKDGSITIEVDGKQYIEWEDEEPLKEGLLGLRTFRTYLWWDDIQVYQLNDNW